MTLILAAGSSLVAQEADKAAAPQAIKTDPILEKFRTPELTQDADRETKRAERRKASEVRKLIGDTRKVVKSSLESGSTGNQAITEFVNGYSLPRMTQTDSANISRLGELRREFLKDFLDADYPLGSRRFIIEQLALPKLTQIVEQNYHPGVRMSAVVLIGLMNDVDGSSKALPVPSAQCWQTLERLFQDENMPDYIRVGALAGIQRHVDTNRHDRTRNVNTNAIKQQCLAILGGTAAKQSDWQPELNYWMQRRAIQVLGSIGEANGGAIDEIVKVLNDKKKKYWLRLDALVAISKIDPTQIPPVNFENVYQSVARFVAYSLETEAVMLEKEVEDFVLINILYGDQDLKLKGSASSGGGGRDTPNAGNLGLGGGGEGGGRGDERSGAKSEPQVNLPTFRLNDARKRVKAVLHIGRKILKDRKANNVALYSAASDEQKAKIDAIVEAIDLLETETNVGIIDLGAKKPKDGEEEEEDPRSVTQQMADTYRDGSKKLNGLVAGKKAAEENSVFADVEDDADAKAKTAEPPAGGGN